MHQSYRRAVLPTQEIFRVSNSVSDVSLERILIVRAASKHCCNLEWNDDHSIILLDLGRCRLAYAACKRGTLLGPPPR